MKGFIEVNAIRIDNKEIKEFVNINKIVSISLEKSGRTIINFENSFMRISETYEEIKQKIKQAIEPKLMIDEKGNLKEIK